MHRPRAILIDLVLPTMKKYQALERLEELESLVHTYGGVVVVKKLQRRGTPDHHTYIGKGKVEEIANEARELRAQLLIVNGMLKPRQVYELQELLRKEHLQVWDRVDLILKIFEKHATSQEAKLQIELARLRHMGPRIFGMGHELSRQTGGIGTRGIGETNTEIMKRHLRERERKLTADIEHAAQMRAGQRAYRRRQDLQTVSIVGYTNAGKTTLLNALTGRREYAADKLFATLDTRIGQLYLPHAQKIALLSDTIGFIQSLPPDLIEAFRSTLAETVNADVILHVVDACDPHRDEKMVVVEDILRQLGISQAPMLFVFAKMDGVRRAERARMRAAYRELHPAFVSAQSGEGVDTLLRRIESMLK
ncbi:GTPase HflX [Candidatus Uhrbacteria bacterium]|nr:GTPase HflX [Candidatus Uhrbacteria bacterium]